MLAIPALIVLVAAGAGGYQVWSQHEARAGLDDALASLPAGSQGHYDAMNFNVFTHTLRIDGLAITRDGHPTLTTQEIVVHHLAGSGTLADPFEASDLRVVGTEIWRGTRSLAVALIQGQSVAVLAPGVPAPPGTPSWLAVPGNGTLLTAGSIIATTIVDNEGATLTALSITDYDAGHLGQASADGFADRQGNRIASVDARALDLGGLDAVFDTGRYGAGESGWSAPRSLIGHAEIVGVQSQDKGRSATVDTLTLDNFAARPFLAAPNTKYVKTQAFVQDAAAAMSVGAVSVAGLVFQDDQTKLSGRLSALSVSGYADGALSQASLDGLAVSGSGASKVKVEHFELQGLTATKLLHEPAGSSTESLISAAGDGGVHLARLALARASVTSPQGQTITLESAEQTESGKAPTLFKASLRGLTIPAKSSPELAQELEALGIDTLVLDLEENGAFDAAAGTASLDPFVLTARDLGSLSLSAQFADVPHDLQQQASPIAALGSMRIGAFTLRFINDSVVQRVIAMEARQTGKTPQDMTGEAKLAGSFGAAALVPQQPDAGQQVAAFIANPHQLTIAATPAAPIAFADFLGAGRDAAKDALNLHLSAN